MEDGLAGKAGHRRERISWKTCTPRNSIARIRSTIRSASPPRLGRCPMESELSALTSELLSRLPTITVEERRLGLEIYRQLAHGEPVSRAELARALEAPTGTVVELVGHPNFPCLTYISKEVRIIRFGWLARAALPLPF